MSEDYAGIELSAEVLAMLAEARDADVAKRRADADRIESLTPLEYLALGVEARYVASDTLTARMARRDVSCIEWSDSDGGWRMSFGNYASSQCKVSPEEVAAILEGRR